MVNKPIDEMSFNDLVDDVTWFIIQSLLSGDKLRTVVHYALTTCLEWRRVQDEKERAPK